MNFSGFRKLLKTPAFWLMLILAFGAGLMSLTGRYGILPHYDLVWDTTNAHRLVHDGEIPLHGGVSAFNSMNPPGVSYGFVPGILVFGNHPVRAERFSAALMFTGTLLGLLFLLNSRLGFWSTVLAMLLFSAGWCGCFFLTSLWPRGHVFFFVWFLYALTRWIERDDGFWLGAALVIFAAGMYWFMEMAPALVLVPALYILYRPKFRLMNIIWAGCLGLLIWMPYLYFEAGRGFSDLKSLVTQKNAAEYCEISDVVTDKTHRTIDAWDVPKLRQAASGKTEAQQPESDGFWLYTEAWGTVWAQKAERLYLGEIGFIFYSSQLNDWYFQSFTSGRILKRGGTDWEPGFFTVDFPTDKKVAVKPTLTFRTLQNRLRTMSPMYNFGGKQTFGLWFWHILLMLGALAVVFAKSHPLRGIAVAFRYWRDYFRRRKPESPAASSDTLIWVVLLLGLVLPLTLQCLLIPYKQAFWESERRFMWLWLAEAAVMGAALGSIRIRRFYIGVPFALAAVYTLSLNPLTQMTIRDAFASWPGKYRCDEEIIIDELGAAIKKDGRESAWIGYDINQAKWPPTLHRIDGYSKSAIEWDVALHLRHGITNLDDTVEGLSANDEYRVFCSFYDVAQTEYSHLRWSMTLDGSLPEMVKISEAGHFQLLRLPQSQTK